MLKRNGKNGISAAIIADSVTNTGERLTTLELEYPRFIHAELLTHRLFSRNSASSRAIPIQRSIEHVLDNPAYPIHWGKNQAGMQADIELTPDDTIEAKRLWDEGIYFVTNLVDRFNKLGCHKQYASRWLETPQMYKTILSGTEFNNLFWLRNHDAAQPEFQELVGNCILPLFEDSMPKELRPGQWHTPYVKSKIKYGEQHFFDHEDNEIDLETAQKLSASCCAQVSYRRLDESIEKSIDIYNKLVGMDRKHSSAFEHIGTPVKSYTNGNEWENGVSHRDRKGQFWSGNFRGWIQWRQVIPNHVVW